MLLGVSAAPQIAHAQPSSSIAACEDWRAQLSAIQGTVEIRRGESGDWIPASESEVLCFGDSVRAQAFSHAIVELRDQTEMRLEENSTLTLHQPDDGIGSLVELLRGVIHIISRDPRSLRFTTPFANAGIEGTEFDIRVDDDQRRTEIAVLEGFVVVTNASGRIDVPSGFIGSAGEGETPVTRAIAEPIELMRWGSYFPEILDIDLPAPDQEPLGAQRTDAQFFTSRAAARLRRGNLDAAEADIAESLRLAPGNADTLALHTIVAVGRNDLPSARERALAATAATPATPAAFIARSHVQQADADLEGTLASTAAAIALSPQNPIAWARRAETELGLGQRDASLESARHAISLREELGYAHTVLGFIRLAGGDLEAAIAELERAASLDPGAPLPHIGLALALMQRDELTLGRRQLEIAVALDPANALSRSYMAKTYDAENRTHLPGTQLELAKRFDPTDPTPWLYDALLKLNGNRPVEALQDLLGAISRNDNRALFRSRLAMDADLATRSAGTGRVMRELGFEDLALVRGWAATTADPTDYAGHRLLADVLSVRPREEISRVSEFWLSQLLQPANLTPVQPQLGQGVSSLISRVGPSELAFSGLAPLVSANGLRLQASTIVGANDTVGEDVAVAGLRDRLSYSVGQFRYSTEGFRDNDDFEQTIANALVQFTPNERTSVIAELRSSEVDRGDTGVFFSPAHHSDEFRFHESAETLRLGARIRLSANDTLLASVVFSDSKARFGIPSESADGDGEAQSNDIQLIHDGERWNLRSGLLWAEQDSSLVVGTRTNTLDVQQASAYAYADIDVARALTLTVGASADDVDDTQDRDVNPKLGLMWNPTSSITVRATSFQTLQGSISTSTHNPQPRLEPAQVAGFNQFPLEANGIESTVKGIAVDSRLAASLFGGVELKTRGTDSLVVSGPAGATLLLPEALERSARTYLYWTPRDDLSVSAQFQMDRLSGPSTSPSGFTHARTKRLPLEARYFRANGFNATLRASRLEQQGEFLFTRELNSLEHGEDAFWIFDASLGYRLPNRRGVLSFNIENLFDEDFRFQDIDPENSSISPERMAYLRFTLSFD